MGIIIFIGWKRHSRIWDRKEKLSSFMKKQGEKLIARDLPCVCKSEYTSRKRNAHQSESWTDCDLFLLEEGLVLRGRRDNDGFFSFIFLYLKPGNSIYRKLFFANAEYKKPVVEQDYLLFHIYLIEYIGGVGLEGYVDIKIKYDENTVQILKNKNLI